MTTKPMQPANEPLSGEEIIYILQKGRIRRVPIKCILGNWFDMPVPTDGKTPQLRYVGNHLEFSFDGEHWESSPSLQGPAGIVSVYKENGELWKGVIKRKYTVKVGSNGAWSCDYSALKFTDTPIVTANAVFASTDPMAQVWAIRGTEDLVKATGRAITGVGVGGNLLGLAPTVKWAPVDVLIKVVVEGPTQ